MDSSYGKLALMAGLEMAGVSSGFDRQLEIRKMLDDAGDLRQKRRRSPRYAPKKSHASIRLGGKVYKDSGYPGRVRRAILRHRDTFAMAA